jgi:hypothetical protein
MTGSEALRMVLEENARRESDCAQALGLKVIGMVADFASGKFSEAFLFVQTGGDRMLRINGANRDGDVWTRNEGFIPGSGSLTRKWMCCPDTVIYGGIPQGVETMMITVSGGFHNAGLRRFRLAVIERIPAGQSPITDRPVIRVRPISVRQERRIDTHLCGMSECKCGGRDAEYEHAGSERLEIESLIAGRSNAELRERGIR